VEVKNNKYTLIDHEKKRFSFWATKKDGSNSSAMNQYRNMDLTQGSVVMIGFVQEDYESAYGPKTSNKIINFRETQEQPTVTSGSPTSGGTTQSTAQVLSARGEPSRGQSGGSSDAFGRRLGIQGHINALLSNPNIYGNGDVPWDVSSIVKKAIEIEDEAERQLAPVAEEKPTASTTAPAWERFREPELPTIQVNEDISVEDIAF
jgi:hypothetical protein